MKTFRCSHCKFKHSFDMHENAHANTPRGKWLLELPDAWEGQMRSEGFWGW